MGECKNMRRQGGRELDKEGIYVGTKGALHYFFFILFLLTTNGEVMPPSPPFFNLIQHERGGFNPSLPVST